MIWELLDTVTVEQAGRAGLVSGFAVGLALVAFAVGAWIRGQLQRAADDEAVQDRLDEYVGEPKD